MNAGVEVEGLRKRFGDQVVLEGIDLAISRGTIFGLLGPNGAGKTTLVRILATLLRSDAGSVRVNGFDVVGQAAAVRRTIGLAGQYASVDELLTGWENLLLLGSLAHLGRARARRRAAELLERFELEQFAGKRVGTYSGGMRRRLDLAASLIAAPPVVFLDEPTTGLDPRGRRTMWDVIRGMAAEGTTILLTTQYLEEADALADEIAVLTDGRIVTRGTAAQLKAWVGTERLTAHLRAEADLDRAARVLHSASIDEQARTVTVPLSGPEELRSTLNALFDAGIGLTRTQVTAPTLDDVFLAATSTRSSETR